MVAALLQPATIFTVLAAAAHRRQRRGLATQLAISAVIALTLLVGAPQWWSVAALCGVSTLYALWGLVTRNGSSTFAAGLANALAASATVLTAAGLIGLAAALFTGHGRSPKTPCGPGATTPYCRAMDNPTPTTSIPWITGPTNVR
jgi:hypothetical protein